LLYVSYLALFGTTKERSRIFRYCDDIPYSKGGSEQMSLPVHVDAHFGYKAKGRPRQLVLDEQIYQSLLSSTSGTSRQRLTSRCRALKERLICFDTTKRQTSGHCRAALMAMNY